MNTDRALFLSRLEFLSVVEKERVEERLDCVEDWARVDRADLEVWLGRTVRARWSWPELRRSYEFDLRALERPGLMWLDHRDRRFPAALTQISDPPWGLWVRGEALDTDRLWVAIVGTRQPDEASKSAAYELGRDFAAHGLVVVSGLAWGIDGQAHRGALESGLTVAVLGHGIDSVSPAGHRGLARRVLACGGSLVSEYGPGEMALGYRFVERNRIISGLARTVVVVQAPARSGALWTADFALDQGRDVVVHEAGLTGERGAGTAALARQGAPVIVRADEVLDMWTQGAVINSVSQARWDF